MIKIVILSFLVSSCYFSPMRLAGDFVFDKKKQEKLIGSAEKELIKKAFKGLDLTKMRDAHVHVVGVGHGQTGIEINPTMKSVFHIKNFIRYHMFMRASGVQKTDNIDKAYVDRLVALIRNSNLKFKHNILAFDKHYHKDGRLNSKMTEMYIPNRYIYKLSQEHSDIFEPVISIHPYRKDAVERLQFWAKKGVRFVKWLPNAMGMNPDDQIINDYYKVMVKYNMYLLTHVGVEHSIEAAENQALGNPLLLRRPLSMGVNIIAAHGAAIGKFKDFENNNQLVDGYELLLRMMDEPKYKGLLQIDISATLARDRLDRMILKLLERRDLHSRLVYGSDYPVPAVNVVMPLGKLMKMGFLTEEQVKPLSNIYKINPILFNFVLFRSIKHPKTGQRFTDEAFYF